jgi:hypothetical protein
MIKIFNPSLKINKEIIFLPVSKEERITLFDQGNGIYDVKFKLYATPTSINLVRFWKKNKENNVISIIDQKENVNLDFKYAELIGQYKPNQNMDGLIEIQFRARNESP